MRVSPSYVGDALFLSERLEEALIMKKLILDMTRIEPENLEIEAFCNNEDTNGGDRPVDPRPVSVG